MHINMKKKETLANVSVPSEQSPEARTARSIQPGIEVMEGTTWKEERKFSVETSFWKGQGSRPHNRITEVT